MSRLRRLLGLAPERPVPPHITEALDTANAAGEAADEAHTAVRRYWRAVSDREKAVIDAYDAAEKLRLERRAHR